MILNHSTAESRPMRGIIFDISEGKPPAIPYRLWFTGRHPCNSLDFNDISSMSRHPHRPPPPPSEQSVKRSRFEPFPRYPSNTPIAVHVSRADSPTRITSVTAGETGPVLHSLQHHHNAPTSCDDFACQSRHASAISSTRWWIYQISSCISRASTTPLSTAPPPSLPLKELTLHRPATSTLTAPPAYPRRCI